MGYDRSIPTRLKDYGLKVVEIAGWQTRGSSSFHPQGSVTHHTVGSKNGNAPSLAVVVYGRSGLPGPLANVLQARDNTIYVVAAGRANHAGQGSWRGLSGNSSVFGNEVENTGYNTGPSGEPWQEDQIDTMARVAAAMADGRWGAEMSCFHKEWTPRKIDAHTLSGADLRKRVTSHLQAGGMPDPLAPNLEDEVTILIQDSSTIYVTNMIVKRRVASMSDVRQIQNILKILGKPHNVSKFSNSFVAGIPTVS